MDNQLIKKAEEFATKAHAEVNHYYNGMPYAFHLELTYQFALEFINIIPTMHRPNVLAAIWLHDTIEDCRLTYNDIKAVFNDTVADLVYAVTNEKGKTRRERANDKYYAGIRSVKYAIFVKLCDRLANVYYSRTWEQSAKLQMYQNENVHFLEKLITNEHDREMYGPIIEELNKTFEPIYVSFLNI